MSIEEKSVPTRALVLAGGGVSGIAWEIGILTALKQAGLDFRNADLIIGTSAGSVVGSQIACGLELEKIMESQLAPLQESGERGVDFDATKFQQIIMQQIMEHGADAQAIRAGIGKMALEADTVPEQERLEIIASRLPAQDWPEQKLLITAVEAVSGEWVVFDRSSGVKLIEAVAASCAVPLVWPTVTINGKRYMDGGIRSVTNADLAAGIERVLILVPLPQPPNTPPFLGSNLEVEQTQLEKQGSQVMVISADQESIGALGTNVLDPVNRAASARAGLRQGEAIVNEVRQFWQ